MFAEAPAGENETGRKKRRKGAAKTKFLAKEGEDSRARDSRGGG